MPHQGMVHALEEIRRLLSPSGVLIDIHPVQEAPLIEVISAGHVFYSEAEPDTSLEDYRQAEGALADVVQRHLYVLESTSEFDLLVHSTSVPELANACITPSLSIQFNAAATTLRKTRPRPKEKRHSMRIA